MAEDGKFYVSKQIANGVPAQTVEASQAELAQIERKLGVSVRRHGRKKKRLLNKNHSNQPNKLKKK